MDLLEIRGDRETMDLRYSTVILYLSKESNIMCYSIKTQLTYLNGIFREIEATLVSKVLLDHEETR